MDTKLDPSYINIVLRAHFELVEILRRRSTYGRRRVESNIRATFENEDELKRNHRARFQDNNLATVGTRQPLRDNHPSQ